MAWPGIGCLLDESHLWKALDTAMAAVQSQSALAETVPAPLLVLDPQGAYRDS